jgi:transposase, IS30 family
VVMGRNRDGFGGRGRGLPLAVKAVIFARLRAGETWRSLETSVGVSQTTVKRVLAEAGGMPPRWEQRPTGRLVLEQREEISRGIAAGESNVSIAARVGIHPSSVGREITRNGGREAYRANAADRRAFTAAQRPRASKLVVNAPLHDAVGSMLERRLSPEQISARLVIDFPDDPEMRVSPETIYQSLYVQARGGFRKELTAALRSGRVRRRPHTNAVKSGPIKDMINISERPAEADDRAVPGHWEGDLIIGKNGKSAIATLVERSTRYALLASLPDGRDAISVRVALCRAILTLPAHLWRSLAWDQGGEMADHVQFSIDTDIDVYFCDPHSPWQRGSNENTNGLLRQYYPKGTDLSVYDQAHLDGVAAELNGRPRKTLQWMTPSEKLAELIATAA